MRRTVVRRPPGRRARILAVAAGQFHRDGYHQVSMAAIAAEVGITAPALYRHYRGKAELLRCALESGLAAVHEAVAAAGDGPGLCAALAEAAVERREFGTLWQRDGRLLPPARRAALRRELRAAVRATAQLVRGDGAAGPVRGEAADGAAELRCWAVLSAYGSLSHHSFGLPRRRFEEVLRALGERLLAVPLPGGPAAAVPVEAVPAEAGEATRRGELVAAATRLFHRRGYDNVSMEQLGSAVGIAGPSVYKHFGTKAAVLAEVLERGRERLRREVVSVLEGPAGPDAALAAFAAFAWRERDYLGAMLSETGRLAPADRRAALDFRREFLRAWVELARTDGESEAEVRIRVHAMIAVTIDTTRSGAANPETVAALAGAALGSQGRRAGCLPGAPAVRA
ncbi:helix-turn-helix domain-containing protein [Kitasatospora sp. NPDC049285]|uniref:TetR/AcrR family transcriptional regulator n=1 Tax=Kitasatospora sp. NPDC049285 TaxID=3157096 RepID=UPI0034155B2E